MNKYHQEILESIKLSSALPTPDRNGFGLKYVGTNKPSYHLNTAAANKIVKDFLHSHDLNQDDFIDLINSLYQGESYDEVTLAAKFLNFSPKTRIGLDPKLIDGWLDHVCGWAETDVLCQMVFSSDELLGNWSEWKKILIKLNRDPNIHKRRASLVLLTKPARQSVDHRLLELAFENTSNLIQEKDILITKAVSWILRSLIKNFRPQVEVYLNQNRNLLPKIAVREVSTKLLTGKKYINSKKA